MMIRILGNRVIANSIPKAPVSKITRYFSPKVDITTHKPDASSETHKHNENEPVKFYGSKAATWKAKSSRDGGAENTLWFQPYVISASLAVFLIYFCILREENDIDMALEKNLYEQVKGMEETQLLIAYKYNLENGKDVRDLQNRLKELGVEFK